MSSTDSVVKFDENVKTGATQWVVVWRWELGLTDDLNISLFRPHYIKGECYKNKSVVDMMCQLHDIDTLLRIQRDIVLRIHKTHLSVLKATKYITNQTKLT